MKKLSHLLLNPFLILAALCFSVPAAPAEAALSDWQRGGSIQPMNTTELGSDAAKRSMDALKATGANYVTLIIPYYQNNRSSTAMYPSWNTPTDAALITAIDYAHTIGLKVMLKPHLETDYIEWRGNIEVAPADRPAWYESYATMLEHYGRIGQTHGVEDFCIGTEILRMASPDYNADNTTQWKKMIARTRAVFSGKLTYSANWYGELDRIGFWPDLDYIGISAYYDLYHAANSSPSELKKSWDGWRTGVIEPMQKKYNKPVVFTELGYRSIVNAHRDPWDWSRDGAYNETDQANSYQALFEYWNAYPWMKGVQLWRWEINPPAANSGDKDYTPQNKMAVNVMTSSWSGAGTTPPPPTGTTTPPGGTPPPGSDPTPVPGTSWTASASTIPASPATGNNVSITATVKNQSTAAVSNTTVDFEIYNPSGTLAFQKYFETQAFGANQQKSYNVNWTAGANGTYTFKIGVFNSTWTYNYYWGNEAAKIIVGGTGGGSGGGTTSPPTASSLEIWWPGANSTVQGVQPFKAMLTNNDVANYNMYWQVDGDRLNEMMNSPQDYPHKEALVDLSGWTWKSTGIYNINFVAKDKAGAILKSKAIDINVTH